VLHRWRDEAVKAGRTITRIALVFEAGRVGFWVARWLAARGVEPHVIHPSAFDSDAQAGLDYLAGHARCTGRLGVTGICLGGHLAFRAAMDRDVLAAACFYATDIDTATLGKGDDSLKRAGDIKGELLTVWGRQDPPVPLNGCNLIRARLEEVEANFQWHEVNGQHAFLRDEGPRYDPALAYRCYGPVFELFHRRLGSGDLAD
jgi:carboxymethylenebutenolidase